MRVGRELDRFGMHYTARVKPSIEAGTDCFGSPLPLAKNLPRFLDAGPLFYEHFAKLRACDRRVSFSAIRDSS